MTLRARMHCLVFRLGQHAYAVDAALAREVIDVEGLTPLPEAPRWLRGTVFLRAETLPVLDVKQRLGQGRTDVGTRGTGIVVVMAGRPTRVCIVDAEQGVRPGWSTRPRISSSARRRTSSRRRRAWHAPEGTCSASGGVGARSSPCST